MRLLSNITAAILVGGAGTRLRGVVADRPKPLALVGDRPFVAYLLDQIARAGVTRAVLCTGHMAPLVEQQLGRRHGALTLDYSVESAPFGTGGALRLALPKLPSDIVLAMNGDSYCDADIAAFTAFHEAAGAEASILMARVSDGSAFGRIRADDAGRVLQFEEKTNAAGPAWINAGVYLFSRRFIESIPPETPVSLEREVFPARIGRGLFGWRADARFIDIGTPDSYRSAAAFFAG